MLFNSSFVAPRSSKSSIKFCIELMYLREFTNKDFYNNNNNRLFLSKWKSCIIYITLHIHLSLIHI